MKYKIRSGFNIQRGDKVIFGPEEIELSEKEFQLEKHKLEAVEPMEHKEAPKAKKTKKDE